MELVSVLDVIFRVVHVSTAIVLVGGSVFTLMVLLPSAKLLSEESHATFAAAVNGRWKRFIHLGVLLFIISGFYNYTRAVPLHKGDGLYHGLLLTKMLLAFVIFYLAAALVGRSPKLEGIRANKPKYLKVVVLLAAIIVSISGYVKVRGVPAVDPVATSDTSVPAE